jgi:hypothetical protein
LGCEFRHHSGRSKALCRETAQIRCTDCYNVLFDHFHGRLQELQGLDKAAAIIELELEAVGKRLQRKLQTHPDRLRKLELEAKKKQVQRAQRQSRPQSKQTAFEFALGVQEPEADELTTE